MKHWTKLNGETLEQRVWEYMAARETPVKSHQIRLDLQLEFWAVIGAMRRLSAKGSIVRVSSRYQGLWIAGPRPDDARGHAPGSVKARLGRWSLEMVPVQVHASPLAQALAWAPNYCGSRVGKNVDSGYTEGGAVRPEASQ